MGRRQGIDQVDVVVLVDNAAQQHVVMIEDVGAGQRREHGWPACQRGLNDVTKIVSTWIAVDTGPIAIELFREIDVGTHLVIYGSKPHSPPNRSLHSMAITGSVKPTTTCIGPDPASDLVGRIIS